MCHSRFILSNLPCCKLLHSPIRLIVFAYGWDCSGARWMEFCYQYEHGVLNECELGNHCSKFTWNSLATHLQLTWNTLESHLEFAQWVKQPRVFCWSQDLQERCARWLTGWLCKVCVEWGSMVGNARRETAQIWWNCSNFGWLGLEWVGMGECAATGDTHSSHANLTSYMPVQEILSTIHARC